MKQVTVRAVRFAVTAASLAIVTGCGKGEGSAASERITVAATPSLDIADTGTAALHLDDFSDAVRLSNGNVVVADDRGGTLREFDSTGRAGPQGGRKGPGPGEFTMIKRVLRCGGDSLFAWDPMQMRMSVFDAGLKFARTFRLPSNTWKVSCNSAGAISVITSPAFQLPSADAPELFATVILLSSRGDSIARIDSVPAGRNRPMVPITEVARTPAGVLVATGDSSFIEVFSDSGHRVATLRLVGDRRPVTTVDYQMAIDSIYLAPMPLGPQRDRLRGILTALPMPAQPPVYRQLFTDPAGDAWVIVSWPADPDLVLRGVAFDGKPLGDMHLPRSLAVFEVGSDYVLARRLDPTGVPHLVVYRFLRGT